jgi:Replication-relaxation
VRLARWLSEVQSAEFIARELGLRPDGFGIWRQDGRDVAFWLEWDRGTEPLDRLRDKLDRYADLEHSYIVHRQDVAWVLVCVPSTRRERHFRQSLTTRAPVATGVLGPDTAPDAAIWWPITSPRPTRAPDRREPRPAA